MVNFILTLYQRKAGPVVWVMNRFLFAEIKLNPTVRIQFEHPSFKTENNVKTFLMQNLRHFHKLCEKKRASVNFFAQFFSFSQLCIFGV